MTIRERGLVNMEMSSFLSKDVRATLKKTPPGEWLPDIPEECILLSAGYPAPEFVPSNELQKAVATLLEEEHDSPLQYIGSPRVSMLKTFIQRRLTSRGMDILEEELLVTSGACQAIDLSARLFVDADTVVAIEAPTYMEALEIFQNYTEQFISIPVDNEGLQTDLLENILTERSQKGLPLPRLLYTIPTSQNPTGTTMPTARRKHLLALADQFNFLIIEDDAYGELAFDQRPTTLKAMDMKNRVIHIGSFSKVVAPGMRIGWVASTREIIKSLAWFKKDLGHPFSQATMMAFLESINFDKRLNTLRKAYEKKCKTLIEALDRVMPSPVTWYIPEGGYFVWLKIAGMDTSKLLTRALSQAVSFIPGKYFYLRQEEGVEKLRLSFSYASEQDIVKGIKILETLIKEHRNNK